MPKRIEGQKELFPEAFKDNKFEGLVEVLDVLPGIVAIRALDIKVVFKPEVDENGKIIGAKEYQDKEKIGSRSTRKIDIWVPAEMYRHIKKMAIAIFKEQRENSLRAKVRTQKEKEMREKQPGLP